MGLVVVGHCGTFAESFGVGGPGKNSGPEAGESCVWSAKAACPVSVFPGAFREPEHPSHQKGRGTSDQPWRCWVYLAWGWISCDVAS